MTLASPRPILPEPNEASACIDFSKVCVVVPAFNEAPVIGAVITSIQRALPGAQVVVVDDGSTDGTGDHASESGATLLRLPVNLGIGGAVQTGYKYAFRAGYIVAIQIDGDGQHDPMEALHILKPVLDGSTDLAIGSRWLGRGDYVAPKGRRLGMRMLARIVGSLTGQRFTDTTSGFRAVGPRCLALFVKTYPTDYPEVESIVLAARHGLVVREFPVCMVERQHGRSSIRGITSAYYMARIGLALTLSIFSRGGRQ